MKETLESQDLGAQRGASSARLAIAVHGEQFLEELLNHGRSELTVKIYRYRLRYFDDWRTSVGIHLEAVTRGNIEAWISQMRGRSLSLKSIRDWVGAVRCFYEWLTDLDFLPKNPLARLKPIKVPRKVPQVLPINAIEALLKATKTTRERVIIEVLYGSGLRASELLGIRVQDLDLDSSQVLVHGKGNKERLQPLSPGAVQAIRTWLEERAVILKRTGRESERALFIGRKGRLHKSHLRNIVKALAVRAGIDTRVYPHLFRHSFATHLLEGGADLRYVQELMGHDSVGTTQIYTHVALGQLRKVYASAHPRAGLRFGSPVDAPILCANLECLKGPDGTRGHVLDASIGVRFCSFECRPSIIRKTGAKARLEVRQCAFDRCCEGEGGKRGQVAAFKSDPRPRYCTELCRRSSRDRALPKEMRPCSNERCRKGEGGSRKLVSVIVGTIGNRFCSGGCQVQAWHGARKLQACVE
jgi:site-specific recombinase XerD